jgi:Mn2+/Fe2+ NRAMP family transporter
MRGDPDSSGATRRRSLLARIGPGVLLAATGVGAGDLATAGIAGTRLGLAVAWAVVLGALLKYVLTEGLARWQLATGETLLEGAKTRLGMPFRVVFLLYLLPWTFFTGGALISASGTAMNAVLPLDPEDPSLGRVVYGVGHSAAGVVLVLLGGFRLFERVMTAAVGVMVAGVLITAVLSRPDLGELAAGLVVPSIPEAEGGLTWTVALLGGGRGHGHDPVLRVLDP